MIIRKLITSYAEKGVKSFKLPRVKQPSTRQDKIYV